MIDEHVLTWLKEHFGKFGEFVYTVIVFVVDVIEGLFDGIIGGIKKVCDGIVKIFNGNWKEGLKDIFSGLLSILIAPFKSWYDSVYKWCYNILDLLGLIDKQKIRTFSIK